MRRGRWLSVYSSLAKQDKSGADFPKMMSRLEEILRVKREEIELIRPNREELRRRALERADFRNFRAALARSDGHLAVIAEVKKASPSAGVIARTFDAVATATKYEQAGCDAISVLTDRQFFQGDLRYLGDVRKAVSVPLLRKDFILEEIQVAESAAMGADAILLIVAALSQKDLVELREAAAQYRLDALVEVHTADELRRAVAAGAEIIGINNRNLATFTVDLSVTEKLSAEVPDEIVLISESGIRTGPDVARLEASGVDAVLVGEALMREELSIHMIRSALRSR
jgi:indole-3-glycerol phosphate synthase